MRRTIIVLMGVCVAGCAATNPGGEEGAAAGRSATSATPVTVPVAHAAGGSGGVIALLEGRPVRWSELEPRLIEAAGAQVLGEYVLDQRIEEEMDHRGIAVTPQDIDAERRLMLKQLSKDPDEAVRLLERVRQNRALGDVRFAALLRRNASLRKLIAAQTHVTDAMVHQAWREVYGEKTVVRLIMVPTLTEASEVVKQAKSGASFIDLAIHKSKDVSRNQGGLLPPISVDDPTYPEVVRQTATSLQPGQVSDPVTLENGFAILKCERKIAAEKVPFEKVAADLRDAVTLRVQRMLMQRQARTLLEKADVTVLDSQLNQDWHRRRSEILGGG